MKMRTIGQVTTSGALASVTADVQIPEAVYKVHRMGYTVIPQTGGEPKRPLVKWRELQERQLTLEELTEIVHATTPGTDRRGD